MLLLLLVACSRFGDVAPSPHGGVSACPESPNCVSSLAPETDTQHHVAPLPLRGSPAESVQALRALVLAQPGTELIGETATSLHFTYTSATFHFVDDLQLIADPAAGLVHLRSASRVGYGDLGVNRDRVEALRAAWEALPATTTAP